MPRYHNINGNKVQFTAEEETARDAEEQAWEDGAFDRAIARLRQDRNRKLKETYLKKLDHQKVIFNIKKPR